jgi:phage tail sheath protein FI
MALFSPSESPAVVVKEIDLTGGVPNVQSTTGAIVGNFRWGPVEKRTLIANETELVERFGSPDSATTIDFHSASYFLRYSSSLNVVRIIDSADNSTTQVSAGAAIVKNEEDFEAQASTLQGATHEFIGRYPGSLGNSLQVQICYANDSAFPAWNFKSEFDAKPGTSNFLTKKNGVNDEVHAVVLDKDGKFTGTKNSVLERYSFLSLARDAKAEDGSSIYVKDVINERSQFIHMAGFDSATVANVTLQGRVALDSGDNFTSAGNSQFGAARVFNFTGGSNSSAMGITQFATGHDLFEDKDQVEIDFLISPSMVSTTEQTTVVNDLIATAQSLRKDCVVVASPARDDVVGLTSASDIVTNVVATADTFTKSSYLFNDGNFLKIYDKFNDQFIQIPAASSTAGLMAATDINRAAWFSPAGSRRGQYLGITALAYTPTKGQRDTLYKASVNPIANIPGAGVILFGDKTGLRRASAFDRINVRRLFLILERAIGRAAEQVLFEFNDEFTRAEFVNIIEPVLREIKGRRGITDFRVVADATNNTAAVIDRNEFRADIFIKPARSINFVTLNFVAVRTGVDFQEVVGTV